MWQLECRDLQQRGAHLLRTQHGSDCSFFVGVEKELITGHKLYLASSSPVFAKLLSKSLDSVPIPDVDPELFRVMLKYIYTDTASITSCDFARRLYYRARDYMLPYLVAECTSYLLEHVQPENACSVYEFAKSVDEKAMIDKCVEVFKTKTKQVISASSFEEASLDTVVSIFSLEQLNVDSELDLARATERYGQALKKRTPENSVKSSAKEIKVPELPTSPNKISVGRTQTTPEKSSRSDSKRKDDLTIRDAVQQIRFLATDRRELALCACLPSLMDEAELLAIVLNHISADTYMPMPSGFSTSRKFRTQVKNLKELVMNASNFKEIEIQLSAVQIFRALSIDKNPSIDELIDLGMLPILIKCLSQAGNPELQHEAALALTNTTASSSHQAHKVVAAGAVPVLIQLLRSPIGTGQDHALRALGHIIAVNSVLRDNVLEEGLLPVLLRFIWKDVSIVFLRSVTAVIFNLCMAPLPETMSKQILPALNKLMAHNDVEILVDTLWATANFLEGKDSIKQIQMIIESDVTPNLIRLLSHKDEQVLIPALQAVRKIAAGANCHKQVVLDCGALSHFPTLLSHQNGRICKEVVWTLSNITNGNKHQAQAVIEAGLLPWIMEQLGKGYISPRHTFYAQREAAGAICNLSKGTGEQVAALISCGAIPLLCNLLACEDHLIVNASIIALKNILEKTSQEVKQVGGHRKVVIKNIASDIIEKYFQEKEVMNTKISTELNTEPGAVKKPGEDTGESDSTSDIVSQSAKVYERAKNTATVRMVIGNVKNLTEFFSSTFYVRNLPWRVRAQRLNEETFSVSLQCNWEVKDDWSCEAEWELTVFSDCTPLVARRKDTFTVDGSSAAVGVMSWGQLTNGDNGFISNNCITLEVCVAAVTL